MDPTVTHRTAAKDVALLAGVSTATVSRALNTPDTRQSDARVRRAAFSNRGAWAPTVTLAISRRLLGQLPRSYDVSPGLL